MQSTGPIDITSNDGRNRLVLKKGATGRSITIITNDDDKNIYLPKKEKKKEKKEKKKKEKKEKKEKKGSLMYVDPEDFYYVNGVTFSPGVYYNMKKLPGLYSGYVFRVVDGNLYKAPQSTGKWEKFNFEAQTWEQYFGTVVVGGETLIVK